MALGNCSYSLFISLYIYIYIYLVCLCVTSLHFSINFIVFGAMFGGENKKYAIKFEQSACTLIRKNYPKNSNCGMAFRTTSVKQKTSSGSAPVLFGSLPSFVPLSLKIPIDDGYHESFSLDCCFL